MTFFPWISFKAINKTSFTSFIFHPRKSLIYTTLYSPIHVYTTFDIVYKKINQKNPIVLYGIRRGPDRNHCTIEFQGDDDGAIVCWWCHDIMTERYRWCYCKLKRHCHSYGTTAMKRQGDDYGARTVEQCFLVLSRLLYRTIGVLYTRC